MKGKKGRTVYEILSSPPIQPQTEQLKFSLLETKPMLDTTSDKEIWAISLEKGTVPIRILRDQKAIRIAYWVIGIFLAALALLVFLSFYIGLSIGRNVSTSGTKLQGKVSQMQPNIPQSFWSIKLYQWNNVSSEQVTAIIKNQVTPISEALKRRGLDKTFLEVVSRNAILYYGKYRTKDDPEIPVVYNKLKNFQINGKYIFTNYLTLEQISM